MLIANLLWLSTFLPLILAASHAQSHENDFVCKVAFGETHFHEHITDCDYDNLVFLLDFISPSNINSCFLTKTTIKSPFAPTQKSAKAKIVFYSLRAPPSLA